MKCAVIDVGSNTIRLSVYKAEGTSFKILFSEKAGVAHKRGRSVWLCKRRRAVKAGYYENMLGIKRI